MDDENTKKPKCELRGFCRFCTEGDCPINGEHVFVKTQSGVSVPQFPNDDPGWTEPAHWTTTDEAWWYEATEHHFEGR